MLVLALGIAAAVVAMHASRADVDDAIEAHAVDLDKAAAVIVEPRAHPLLAHVIDTIHAKLPIEYDLYVFHGTRSGPHAARAVSNVVASRRVFLVALPVDDLSADDYNALLTSVGFWKSVRAERVLVFQTDAVLCARSERSIRDFEHLGYVGCAYGDHVGGKSTYWGVDHAFWGSGGLSFRRKSVALRCLRDVVPEGPEDVYFSNCVDGTAHAPTVRDMVTFCNQEADLGTRPLGAHKISGMCDEHRATFVMSCPEASVLIT